MKEDVLRMKDVVNKVLTEHPFTRNSDTELNFKVLEEIGLATDTRNGYYILKKNLSKMPAFQSIRLNRQIIQNQEGRLLPTDPEVLEQRKLNDAEMRQINKWYDEDEEDPDELINRWDGDVEEVEEKWAGSF